MSVALETRAAACTDTDDGVTDRLGLGCEARDVHGAYCHPDYDDDDFTMSTMCCTCGGGASSASEAVHDALSALPWVQLSLSLLIVAFSLFWHRRRQPYAFASQNALESGLLSSVLFLLLLAILSPSRAMPWRRPMER